MTPSKPPHIAVMPVHNRVHAGRQQITCGVIFDPGVNAQKLDVEVTTVSGRECTSCKAGQHQAPKPRSQRQPHPGIGEQAIKSGKTDDEALIQGPALTRSRAGKRDGVPNSAHDALLRHRPRSISAIRCAFHAERARRCALHAQLKRRQLERRPFRNRTQHLLVAPVDGCNVAVLVVPGATAAGYRSPVSDGY